MAGAIFYAISAGAWRRCRTFPACRKIPEIERLENAFADIDRLMAERQSECPSH